MVSVKVLFFANLKDLTGVRQVELSFSEPPRVSELKEEILRQFPGIAGSLQTSIVAVNHEFSQDTDLLRDQDEIALFPPVSGGSTGDRKSPDIQQDDIYLVTENQLNIDDLLARITQPSTGAICMFTGVVRGLTQRNAVQETQYLEYEAYVPMAEEKMRQVGLEIRRKWPAVEKIAVVQRIGKLYPGTPTIAIACSAAHRDTGVFEAARYGIDRLKEIVPIWKKEVGLDGEAWVEGEYFPKPGE